VLCVAVDERKRAEIEARKLFEDAEAAWIEDEKIVAQYFPVTLGWPKSYSIPFTAKQVKCLEAGAWISDQWVEFGTQLILEEELTEEAHQGTCYCMSTYFCEHLREVHLKNSIL
jgi:Ulp1 family protease